MLSSRISIIFVTISLVLVSRSVCSQPTNDYLEKAQQFHVDYQLDSAMRYYQLAIESIGGDDLVVERLYLGVDIVSVFYDRRQWFHGISLLNRVLPEGLNYNHEDERLALLEAQLFKAYGLEQSGDFIRARSAYETALLRLVDEEGGNSFYVARYIYQPLGNIYTRLGDLEEALSLLGKFKLISEENDEYVAAAEAVNDIGIVYKSLGYYDEVIADYQSALSYPNLPAQTIGLIYSNLATALYETRKFKEALSACDQAAIYLNKGLINTDDPRISYAYLSQLFSTFGKIYTVLDQPVLAMKYFEQAIRTGELAYGSANRRELAKINVSRGYLYLEIEEMDKALVEFHRALTRIVPGFMEDEPNAIPSAEQLYAENTIFEALDGKTRVYEKQYETTGDEQNLERLLDTFEVIHGVEFLIRQQQRVESSKLLIAYESHVRNERAIQSAFQLYDLKGDARYAEMAFQIAERNKAAILLESIKNLKTKSLSSLPDSLLEKHEQLVMEVERVKVQILSHQEDENDEMIALLQKELDSIKNEEKLLVNMIREKDPDYYQLQWHGAELVDLEHLRQQVIGKDGQLLSYFLGEDHLYIFSITKREVSMKRLSVSKRVEELVDDVLDMIRQPGVDETMARIYREKSGELYELLLKPFLFPGARSLTIIPDGVLGYLPFDALVTSDLGGNRFDQFNYLINDLAVSYGFSAQILLENYLGVKQTPAKEFLGMAPVFEEDPELAFLPFSEKELDEIGHHFDGKSLVREAATREAFFTEAGQYGIVHLSSHAAVVDSLPLYGWIAFTAEENRERRLFVNELYALDLKAELVVLSACETGSGRLSRGEGIMSLSRGFAHAGCQSLVTTLWPVNDVSTSDIMTSFYENLASGMRKDEALRAAKRSYLSRPDLDQFGAHPFFWAAYVPMGNMQPVSSGFGGIWYWIGGVMMVIIVFGFVRKRFAKVKV